MPIQTIVFGAPSCRDFGDQTSCQIFQQLFDSSLDVVQGFEKLCRVIDFRSKLRRLSYFRLDEIFNGS